MATITVTTTQNIELEYELANVGERILAGLIDLVILAAYFILTMIVYNIMSFNKSMDWLYVLGFIPAAFYSLLSEILLNGQSVGKKVLGIKVISLSGEQPSLSQYLIRWLFRLVDLWFFFFIPAIILTASTIKSQRLGDIIAGTGVIKTKPKAQFSQTIFTPVADATAYQAVYPAVVNLSDRDMQLIKEVMINVKKTGNNMLALQTMEKIEQTLDIKSQHEPLTFLYAVISDYNHLTARL